VKINLWRVLISNYSRVIISTERIDQNKMFLSEFFAFFISLLSVGASAPRPPQPLPPSAPCYDLCHVGSGPRTPVQFRSGISR
jgi:hypothetical protein